MPNAGLNPMVTKGNQRKRALVTLQVNGTKGGNPVTKVTQIFETFLERCKKSHENLSYLGYQLPFKKCQ